jgi:1-aminocyclopropane-1-carboxylate deaminase/D-cysteine desulfhydrase-like pyridoxal-dependent ACC family enzyme
MIMNKRRGYPTTQAAIAGGIEQMEQAKLVGFAVSAQDAKLRHTAACEAMARSNAESLKMMARLRNNIKRKPLSADEMSELYYPKRRIK